MENGREGRQTGVLEPLGAVAMVKVRAPRLTLAGQVGSMPSSLLVTQTSGTEVGGFIPACLELA